eukprot:GDKK01057705.1.p2 GENE.GDKK01057705.1~~GDKK01057705.1.p2  ORF type:complete len:142 (+),score=3.24 GDKK01057705.1:330-755(+)
MKRVPWLRARPAADLGAASIHVLSDRESFQKLLNCNVGFACYRTECLGNPCDTTLVGCSEKCAVRKEVKKLQCVQYKVIIVEIVRHRCAQDTSYQVGLLDNLKKVAQVATGPLGMGGWANSLDSHHITGIREGAGTLACFG